MLVRQLKKLEKRRIMYPTEHRAVCRWARQKGAIMQKYRVLYNPLSNNMAGERAVKAVKELLCGAEVECVSVIDLDYI